MSRARAGPANRGGVEACEKCHCAPCSAMCMTLMSTASLRHHAARASRSRPGCLGVQHTWQELVMVWPVQGAVVDGVVGHPQKGALGHCQLACQADVAAPDTQLPDADRWVPAQQVRTNMLAPWHRCRKQGMLAQGRPMQAWWGDEAAGCCRPASSRSRHVNRRIKHSSICCRKPQAQILPAETAALSPACHGGRGQGLTCGASPAQHDLGLRAGMVAMPCICLLQC